MREKGTEGVPAMGRACLFLSSLLWVAMLSAAPVVQSLPYDYSSSSECLPEPLEPQYGGGILRNANFSAGLHGWSAFGYGAVEEGLSASGNSYGVARNRTRSYQSVSQKVYLQNDTHYTLSAWFQVSDGSADIRAVVKTNGEFIHAGAAEARSGCWSILKGGITAPASAAAELYFESNATVDIWVDSVSLQPFSQEEWAAHHHAAIKSARKKTVRLRAKDSSTGKPVPGAQVRIEHVRSGFPLGSAMNADILRSPAYQRWFTSRFTVTTFENEMKWYSTERVQGHEDYSVPDAMLRFAKSHGIAVRGHNVFWDQPSQQPSWAQSLSYPQLQKATARRIRSVMSRYAGQVIAWDVVNENLHFRFFEDKFGWDASAEFYRKAHQMDAQALMSMNEYNTLEWPGDTVAGPSKYLGKLFQIKKFPGNANDGRMAIGLEGHFSVPSIPYIRAALDTMSKANAPIWLTEIDVAPGPNQARYLEQILREVYAHPAVHGIILWTARHPQGCYVMCLTDNNFRNLPTGDVVDKLIAEWKTHSHAGVADADGYYEAELFHGDYKVTVTHPAVANSTVVQSLSVDRETDSDSEYTIHV